MADVIRIPINYMKRKKNEMGAGYVPCQVSSRYLKLQSIEPVGDQNFIILDVMTESDENRHKKICQMIIAIEDLNIAINEINNKDKR